MKIAFYLNNANIAETDFSKVEDGNPGVGGSEYSCVYIANELCKRGNIDTILLADKESKFPSALKYFVCGNLLNSIKQFYGIVDVFVIDSKRFDLYLASKYPKAKFILWLNNRMSTMDMRKCSELDNIICLLHVGREMYDLYRDASFFGKMTYIYNAISLNILKKYPILQPFDERENRVAYIGSLVPSKGFHLLAKAWPKVLQVVPDAELEVIGSGKLYNQTTKLGKYGIAEKSYEDSFMPYLTDKQGNILHSVHFRGIMGVEKYDILSNCKIGVPNPSGFTETFGYTAVEMEMMGCAVTTMKCPGYIDTVYDVNQLYNTPSQLADYLIRLLKKTSSIDYTSTLKYIKNNFTIEAVIPHWEHLLIGIQTVYPPSSRSNYHCKNLKEFIRIHIPDLAKKHIPCIETIYTGKIPRKYQNVKKRIHNIITHV